MLAFLKLVADFAKGVRSQQCKLPSLRPTPTPPFVDRFVPDLSGSKQVSSSHRSELLIHCSNILCLATSSRAGK
jgi:hypothetical protein